MTEEQLVKGMVRSQWRLEGDITAPVWLTGIKRQWWLEEARKIEQGEAQAV